MDTRATYQRRLERSSHREKRLMTLAVLGVAVGVAGVVLPSPSISWPIFGLASTATLGTGAVQPAARGLSATPPAAQQPGAARRIYRHSVVPGGVADKVELAQILRTDRLVAAHYATFNVDNARAVTVTSPRAVYVSYRKNDQIYWTSKKVMLEQGETLLTDGEHDIRARCANRISDVPQFPVEPHGPSAAELDTVLAVAAPSDMVGVPGEEGGVLPVGMDDLGTSEAVGQRYYATSFPNGAGLLTMANTTPTPSRQGQAPGMPHWYDTPIYRGGVLSPASRIVDTDDTVIGAPAPATEIGGGTVPGNVGIGDTGLTPVAAPDGGGAPEVPVNSTPSLPTPGANTDTPGDVPVTPATPATPATPTAPTPPGNSVVDPVAPTEVPEPGTLWLGGIALAALLWLRRKGPRAR
jgi:hypothetical protein